jgi:hypothetical protein
MTSTYAPPRRGSKRSEQGTRRTGGNGAPPTGRSKVRSTNHHEANPCEQKSAGATRHSSGQRQTPSDIHSASVSGSGAAQPLLRSNHSCVRRTAPRPLTTIDTQDTHREGIERYTVEAPDVPICAPRAATSVGFPSASSGSCSSGTYGTRATRMGRNVLGHFTQ